MNDRATPLQRTESPDSDTEDVDELDPPKALGDILESVAGAIFVDSGCCLESVWRVFKPLFDEKIGEGSVVSTVPSNQILLPTTRVVLSVG